MTPDRHIHNLTLIGFMGTGKTSVGHFLAGLLQFQFVDTDDLIESKAQRKITDIFLQEGEGRFREYEREVVAELCQLRRCVISTGGGLAVQPGNLESLKTHSLVVCLWASAETIWERVKHQSHRPLLQTEAPLDRIRELLSQREPLYRQADVLVNTEQRHAKEVAFQVMHQFRLASAPESNRH